MGGLSGIAFEEMPGMRSPPETIVASQIPDGLRNVPVHSPLETLDGVMRTRARTVKVIRSPSFSVSAIILGLHTLTQYSDLLYTLSLFRLNVRYKQSVLGLA